MQEGVYAANGSLVSKYTDFFVWTMTLARARSCSKSEGHTRKKAFTTENRIEVLSTSRESTEVDLRNLDVCDTTEFVV